MSELPQGPLPNDYEDAVFNIIRDVGINVLTLSVLRKRLVAKYKIDFSPHDKAVEAAVQKYLSSPEGQRELVKAKLIKAEGPVGGKGKKRARSSQETAKESKKDKKGESKTKAKKPDDYPKAALSAYIIFGTEQRDKIKAENPGIAITEILKETGRRWAAAPDEEKERYKKLADKDKARFDRELKAYLEAGGQVHKRGQKDAKKSKEKSKGPKRALSSFMYFANDFRLKHSDISMTEQMKQAGAKWKQMTDEEKKPYELKAAEDKERYQRECREQGLKTKTSVAQKAPVDEDSASSSSQSASDSASESESDDE